MRGKSLFVLAAAGMLSLAVSPDVQAQNADSTGRAKKRGDRAQLQSMLDAMRARGQNKIPGAAAGVDAQKIQALLDAAKNARQPDGGVNMQEAAKMLRLSQELGVSPEILAARIKAIHASKAQGPRNEALNGMSQEEIAHRIRAISQGKHAVSDEAREAMIERRAAKKKAHAARAKAQSHAARKKAHAKRILEEKQPREKKLAPYNRDLLKAYNVRAKAERKKAAFKNAEKNAAKKKAVAQGQR